MNKITILVNTSDGFEDCWEPFFNLFEIYWPNCDLPIVLNTEYKEFLKYETLSIKSAKSSSEVKSENKLSWSECLHNALMQIKTPLVLYLQEDYFIDNKVNVSFIKEMGDLMLFKNRDIKYIGLTDSGNYPPFKPWTDDYRLWVVSQKAQYRISTQAGLWDLETLKSYLKPDENGWMFEIFGTKRAQKRNELFLTLNRDIFKYPENTIVSYILTGVIKSKWHSDIPKLFRRHHINIDFSKRGFYKQKKYFGRKLETVRKLLNSRMIFFKKMRGN